MSGLDVRDWMKRELTGGRCANVVFSEEKQFFFIILEGRLR